MVVGKFPVVETLLAQLLCSNDLRYSATQRVDNIVLLAGGHLQPFGHIAAL